MLEFDEAAHDQEETLRLGQPFAIRLRENPTTGFQWDLQASGNSVCTLTHEAFEPPAGAPGQPGSHVWQFRAVRAGTGRIELVERRPWETDSAPARRFTLWLQVLP